MTMRNGIVVKDVPPTAVAGNHRGTLTIVVAESVVVDTLSRA